MRVVFLGSAAIAIASLEALLASEHDVVFSITRPDKPAGRHRELKAPPLKDACDRLGVEVMQPAKAREVVPQIVESGAEACCVVAYGGWLPPPVLESTPYGCVNVHPSLLPRWRGAAPIERALMAGDDVIGVTTMLIDEGLDTGPVLMQRELAVDSGETAGELQLRAAALGAELLVETLDGLEAGRIAPVPQSDEGVTYADKLESDGCRVDWTQPAVAVDGVIRGANPRPGAWTTLGGERLKLWRSRVVDAGTTAGQPGAVLGVDPLRVKTGDGVVELIEVQPAGKARMRAEAFARGHELSEAVFE